MPVKILIRVQPIGFSFFAVFEDCLACPASCIDVSIFLMSNSEELFIDPQVKCFVYKQSLQIPTSSYCLEHFLSERKFKLLHANLN
jgi:hypothetical protein